MCQARKNPKVKWEVAAVEKHHSEIPAEEFHLRLEEILEILVKKKTAFSPLSTNGLAPKQEEIA